MSPRSRRYDALLPPVVESKIPCIIYYNKIVPVVPSSAVPSSSSRERYSEYLITVLLPTDRNSFRLISRESKIVWRFGTVEEDIKILVRQVHTL